MQSSMAKLFPLLLAVAVTLLITHGLAHAQVTQTVTLTAGQAGHRVRDHHDDRRTIPQGRKEG